MGHRHGKSYQSQLIASCHVCIFVADLPLVVIFEHAGSSAVIDDGDVIVTIVLTDVVLQSAEENRLLFSRIHDDFDNQVVLDIPGVQVPNQVVFLLVFQVIKIRTRPLAKPAPNGIQ